MSLPTGDFSSDKRFKMGRFHNDNGEEEWRAICAFCGEVVPNGSKLVAVNLMTDHVIGCLRNPARVLSDMDEWKIKKGLLVDPLEEK